MSDAPLNDPTPITPEAVESAVTEALTAIADASSTAELKAVRAAHAAEHSPLAHLNAQLRHVPNERKAEFGKLVGQARGRVTQALAAREVELAEAETAARLEAERVDITALPQRARIGARHPLTLLQEQVCDIFVGMGWEIAEGPELGRASCRERV